MAGKKRGPKPKPDALAKALITIPLGEARKARLRLAAAKLRLTEGEIGRRALDRFLEDEGGKESSGNLRRLVSRRTSGAGRSSSSRSGERALAA